MTSRSELFFDEGLRDAIENIIEKWPWLRNKHWGVNGRMYADMCYEDLANNSFAAPIRDEEGVEIATVRFKTRGEIVNDGFGNCIEPIVIENSIEIARRPRREILEQKKIHIDKAIHTVDRLRAAFSGRYKEAAARLDGYTIALFDMKYAGIDDIPVLYLSTSLRRMTGRKAKLPTIEIG